MKKLDITWQELLEEKGIEPKLARKIFAFISWNENEGFSGLGNKITQILFSCNDRLIIKDVTSKKYNDIGLLFLTEDLSTEIANEIFDIIMSYEQEVIYNTKDGE